MMGDDRGPRRVIADAVHDTLAGLDVVAHNPVQGEAMHKVITGYVLGYLDREGYTVARKDGVS